ncbi:MAG: hypothetical protein KDI09_09105 [Halioglobus sp.]|nr:hypothetical protein [Halioglobus sp.]
MRAVGYGIVLTTVIYLLLRWDYHVSKILFAKLCSDHTQVGLHIYEKVLIDDSMLVEIPPEGINDLALSHLEVDDSKMLNPQWFEDNYRLILTHWELISSVGPISKAEARIERVTDGKTLSQTVAFKNHMGWLLRAITFGYDRRVCSCVNASHDSAFSQMLTDRKNLVRQTFYM